MSDAAAAPTVTLVITPAGALRFVYTDELRPLLEEGSARIDRASHVEPFPGAPYGTCWAADLAPVGGPILGPYERRQDALAAERSWLYEHLAEISSADRRQS